MRTGFSIIKTQDFDVAGIIRGYIALVLPGKTTTGKNDSLCDRLVVLAISRIERVVASPIAGNLLVLTRKSDWRTAPQHGASSAASCGR